MARHHITGEIIGYDCAGGSQRYDWVSLDDPRAAMYRNRKS